MFLICLVISKDNVIKRSHEFLCRISSQYVNILARLVAISIAAVDIYIGFNLSSDYSKPHYQVVMQGVNLNEGSNIHYLLGEAEKVC